MSIRVHTNQNDIKYNTYSVYSCPHAREERVKNVCTVQRAPSADQRQYKKVALVKCTIIVQSFGINRVEYVSMRAHAPVVCMWCM